jgi:amidase
MQSRSCTIHHVHQATFDLVQSPRSSLSRREFVIGAGAAALTAISSPARSWQVEESDDLIYQSVLSLSAAIRSRKVSSAELTAALLDRIAAVNPKINAVVTLDPERAMDEARRADAELSQGKLRGVLHGIPMTIKDSFDTAGMISTAGTEGRRTFVPKRDATVVARLKAAGAFLIGKTNTPEFTMSYDTRNLVFGFTLNPYDLSKSPGGSSGGAAAIVAAGGSPFDMGSDTGGSIRVPSCFCGIAGIKPTTGRMPLTGHIIRTGQGLMDPMTQVGPMARFVDDLFPLLRITAGPDGQDPAVMPVPLRHPGDIRLQGLRVAFHVDNGVLAADPDVARTVEAAVAVLSDAGARVEESRPGVLPTLENFWTLPYSADGGDWYRRLLTESRTENWDPHVDSHWLGRALTGEEVGQLWRDWHRFRAEFLAWMNRYDVLVCPATARASLPTGFPLDFETFKMFSYTVAGNLTGWPAAVVRGGTSEDGMPIGVQIVAHAWREDMCLAVARHIESQLGGWKKPPL